MMVLRQYLYQCEGVSSGGVFVCMSGRFLFGRCYVLDSYATAANFVGAVILRSLLKNCINVI